MEQLQEDCGRRAMADVTCDTGSCARGSPPGPGAQDPMSQVISAMALKPICLWFKSTWIVGIEMQKIGKMDHKITKEKMGLKRKGRV